METVITTYRVLVPRPKTRASAIIDAGSGVVSDCEVDTEGRIEVWFEGNRHKAANLNTYGQRVGSAAGRLSTRYPTIAKATCPVEEFIVVGEFSFSHDWSTFALKIDDDFTVAAWCGVASIQSDGKTAIAALKQMVLEMRSAVELSARLGTPIADAQLLLAWADQLATATFMLEREKERS